MSDPEAFRALYRRHEERVLRRAMERVRSPEVAAELTAETFAHALTGGFDASRETEAEWIERLADRELATAYAAGTVAGTARSRARVGSITVDRRALDRVWHLRGPGRDDAPKPRGSSALVVADRAGADGEASLLPGVEAALVDAARSRHSRRRARRRWSLGARVTVALASLALAAAPFLIPDRTSTAATYSTWLPFAKGDVEGFYPRTWYLGRRPQSPAGATERVLVSSFETGDGTDPECGALPAMGATDVLVFLYPRPDGAVERTAHRCAPDARLTWRENALIVLGPEVSREDRALVTEFLERVRSH